MEAISFASERQAECCLLGLPVELRDIILRHALGGHVIHVANGARRQFICRSPSMFQHWSDAVLTPSKGLGSFNPWGAHYRCNKPCSQLDTMERPTTELLRVCRVLREEAEPILYSSNLWTFPEAVSYTHLTLPTIYSV